MDVQPSWLAPPCRVYVSLLLSCFMPSYASLELIALAISKKNGRDKYIHVNERGNSYRDCIISKETRPGWGEAHNTESMCRYHGGVLANMGT